LQREARSAEAAWWLRTLLKRDPLADLEGNIVEISQGYVDEDAPPPA